MSIAWGRKWAQDNWWKLVLVTMAGWTALYIALLAPMRHYRTISEQRATGLAASVGWDPASLWQQRPLFHMLQRGPAPQYGRLAAYFVGGTGAENPMRRVARTEALEVEVKDPADCLDKIRALAERLGGYMVSSESESDDNPSSTISARIPESRFEEARVTVRQMAVRIHSDKLQANDLTKDYVDRDAQLRNFRAAETQYLAIMKRATSVQDTLDVTEKLNGIRGEIEKQQAEFNALARQVEFVALTVTLYRETDAKVFGIHWQPWLHIKMSARAGLESIADYASSMVSALFHLPTFILWVATIAFVLAVTWRFARWAWKKFFLVPGMHT